MKIGIISDIHGNILALNAVLKEFENRKVEKIICCGDIVGIGPHPEQVVQKLIEIKDKIICIVQGNHEQYILNGIPERVHDEKREISKEEIDFHKWTHNQVSDKSKKYLKEIPFTQNIEVYGKKIYVTHYPYRNDNEFKKHIQNPKREELNELFNEIDADIYVYGHTHTITYCESKNKKYINPGSLGCPALEEGADCGILNIDDKNVIYDQIQVPYNVKFVIEEIEKIKYPNYVKVLELFYGKEREV